MALFHLLNKTKKYLFLLMVKQLFSLEKCDLLRQLHKLFNCHILELFRKYEYIFKRKKVVQNFHRVQKVETKKKKVRN